MYEHSPPGVRKRDPESADGHRTFNVQGAIVGLMNCTPVTRAGPRCKRPGEGRLRTFMKSEMRAAEPE